MSRALLPLLLLAACTVERTALSLSPDAAVEITACAAAAGHDAGVTCAFTGACVLRSRADPVCCAEITECVAGRLARGDRCEPGCASCAGDGACARGAELCELGRCVPCPATDACTACPDGWVRLERNGCPTCDCAPPSECDQREDCGPEEICYPGTACATGCASDPTCCANVCAAGAPPCARPAPLGCQMDCPAELGCELCAASACECVAGAWRCRATCARGISGCFLPGFF